LIKLIQYLGTFFFNLHFAFYAAWNLGDPSLKWRRVGSERNKQFPRQMCEAMPGAVCFSLGLDVRGAGSYIHSAVKYEYSFASTGNFFPIVKRKGGSHSAVSHVLCLLLKLVLICMCCCLCHSEILFKAHIQKWYWFLWGFLTLKKNYF